MRIYGALQASMAIMRIFFVSIPAGTKIGDAVIGQGCDLCGEGNVSMLKKSLTAVIVGYVVQALALLLLAAAAGVCIFAASSGTLPFVGGESGTVSEQPYVPPAESAPDETSAESSDPPEEESEVTPEAYLAALEDCQAGLPEGCAVTTDPLGDGGSRLVIGDVSRLGDLSGCTVTARMGFLYITEADGVLRVYDNTLTDVTGALAGTQQLAARDAQGRALFEKDGAYYVFESGALVPSDYDLREDDRGFEFDYPAYLGVQSESVRRFRYGNAYGYVSAGGSMIVTASFREAFAWGEEDVGCVIAAPNGREMLYFYNRRSQEVSRSYYAPDTRGEESVGFFYFDDGLTRVRIRETDADGTEYFREGLMLFDGSLFPLPADYTVRAYSDSVILLEKDGLFGYMSSRGVWLTEPAFIDASPFYEGLAVVTAADGRQGLIDRTGSYVLPAVYDSITNCSDGVVLARSETFGDVLLLKIAADA